MQFVIQPKSGFAASELIRMKSKSGRINFEGSISATWKDPGLAKVDQAVASDFLVKLGINLERAYKAKISAWKSDLQSKMDALEEKLGKSEEKFRKEALKKSKSDSEKQKFVESQNKDQTSRLEKIRKEAQAAYTKLISDLAIPARKTTMKALAEAPKELKKSKLSTAIKIGKWLLTAAVIVAATLALPPAGITAAFVVAAATIVHKSMSAANDAVGIYKEHFKTAKLKVEKANASLASADDAIGEAIADMRGVKDAIGAMRVKKATTEIAINKYKAQIAAASKDSPAATKAISKSTAKADEAQKYMAELDAAVGGDPDAVLANLQAARTALKKAINAMPEPKKAKESKLQKIVDCLDAVSGLADDVKELA